MCVLLLVRRCCVSYIVGLLSVVARCLWFVVCCLLLVCSRFVCWLHIVVRRSFAVVRWLLFVDVLFVVCLCLVYVCVVYGLSCAVVYDSFYVGVVCGVLFVVCPSGECVVRCVCVVCCSLCVVHCSLFRVCRSVRVVVGCCKSFVNGGSLF